MNRGSFEQFRLDGPSLEVFRALPHSRTRVPGLRYFSGHKDIEYIPGTLFAVLAAPHGGLLKPEEVPDLRQKHGWDNMTKEFTLELADSLKGRASGRAPHVIVNHLHPGKLNPAARSKDIGASHDSRSAEAWDAFHAFVEAATAQISQTWSHGLYLELHAHGHSQRWTELGLGLTASQLNEPSFAASATQSTIRSLAERSDIEFERLLRGPTSLGGLIESTGYEAVPSPKNPGPGRSNYFEWGWNTVRYGSKHSGTIDAIHVEAPVELLTDRTARRGYKEALSVAIFRFMGEHYAIPSNTEAG